MVSVTDDDPALRHQLYALAVEMADRVSARRGAANSFYLTVSSALVALAGFAADSDADASTVARAISVAGLLLCVGWWLQLRSYRDLNAAKFAVIQKIERNLPIKVFCEEWDILKRDRVKWWRKWYAELGWVERAIPILFGCVFAFLVWTAR